MPQLATHQRMTEGQNKVQKRVGFVWFLVAEFIWIRRKCNCGTCSRSSKGQRNRMPRDLGLYLDNCHRPPKDVTGHLSPVGLVGGGAGQTFGHGSWSQALADGAWSSWTWGHLRLVNFWSSQVGHVLVKCYKFQLVVTGVWDANWQALPSWQTMAWEVSRVPSGPKLKHCGHSSRSRSPGEVVTVIWVDFGMASSSLIPIRCVFFSKTSGILSDGVLFTDKRLTTCLESVTYSRFGPTGTASDGVVCGVSFRTECSSEFWDALFSRHSYKTDNTIQLQLWTIPLQLVTKTFARSNPKIGSYAKTVVSSGIWAAKYSATVRLAGPP